MKLPKKIFDKIVEEAQKNARFSWYSGWEKTSGYIKSELRGENRYGNVRIYIKWEKKKEPTDDQVKAEVLKYVENLLSNNQHHQTQRDFAHYILETYYVDVSRLKHETMMSIIDNLSILIPIIQESEKFTEPSIQNLFNDLKNLECGISDHEAITQFLELGRKRVGES